jgi:hypothetical protein
MPATSRTQRVLLAARTLCRHPEGSKGWVSLSAAGGDTRWAGIVVPGMNHNGRSPHRWRHG